MITHLLDTSAWLAHLFREPGYEQVSNLLLEPTNQVAVSVLSLLEVYGRMQQLQIERRFEEIVEEYRGMFTHFLPVDERVATRATVLRRESSTRVPAIDALIAATAAHHNATLVHRDPHFAGLPDGQPAQLVLQATA